MTRCDWVWVSLGGCDFMWVGVTGCGWAGKMIKLVCDCLKHIFGYVYFSRRHLWIGVTV